MMKKPGITNCPGMCESVNYDDASTAAGITKPSPVSVVNTTPVRTQAATTTTAKAPATAAGVVEETNT
jgi:hypothetical protein